MAILFVPQMPDCFKRMIQNHPWSSEPHHLSDLLPHILTVAMSRALLAGGLLLTVPASRKPFVGIFLKLIALLTKSPVTLLLAAVQAYHQ